MSTTARWQRRKARGVKPYQALTDQSDGYVIRHGHPYQLLWANSASQVTRRYTDQPAIFPYHMVDDDTDLLVSDPHNHCVHRVTREGRHDGHLITNKDPTSVCLDPAGSRLWVTYKEKDERRYMMAMSYIPKSSPVPSYVTSRVTSASHHASLTLKNILPKIIDQDEVENYV